jgi:hypothetical protein
MAEIGLDISREFLKPLTTDEVQAADVVITMGCGDACPVYPGKRYLDWDPPDPAGLTVGQVRPTRDEIGRRVQALLAIPDGFEPVQARVRNLGNGTHATAGRRGRPRHARRCAPPRIHRRGR